MRQVGIPATAGILALITMVERLAHRLAALQGVAEDADRFVTNIIVATVRGTLESSSARRFVAGMRDRRVCGLWSPADPPPHLRRTWRRRWCGGA